MFREEFLNVLSCELMRLTRGSQHSHRHPHSAFLCRKSQI